MIILWTFDAQLAAFLYSMRTLMNKLHRLMNCDE